MDEGGRNQQLSSFTLHGGGADNDSSNNVLLETLHPEEYSLSYTFFLIPEIASFQLTGELVELLPKWLKDISVSNHWTLEFSAVDPGYFQWALSVPAVVATVQVVQQVRTKLTEHVLMSVKGKIKLNNPTDFWAPGYLLLCGLHQRPIEIVEYYIQLIRRQQKKYSL